MTALLEDVYEGCEYSDVEFISLRHLFEGGEIRNELSSGNVSREIVRT